MTVIAMTREMGTLGKDIAAGVAEQLELEVESEIERVSPIIAYQ